MSASEELMSYMLGWLVTVLRGGWRSSENEEDAHIIHSSSQIQEDAYLSQVNEASTNLNQTRVQRTAVHAVAADCCRAAAAAAYSTHGRRCT